MSPRSRLIAVSTATILALAASARAGGQCQSPNDCFDNNPCTADQCNGGTCANPPLPDGTGCVDPNVCIVAETCSSGYCVGMWQINCCTEHADCDDFNPCTVDSCVADVCQHTNAAPGAPCGSGVDDACTDPDTCDASGQCLTNDTADGEDCGGPDCLAGQCGTASYFAQMLPEGGHIGSEPLGMSFYAGDFDRPIIVGRVIDGSEVDHAAVWDSAMAGQYDLLLLPASPGVASAANDVVCDEAGACVAAGWSGSPSQPAAWVHHSASWAEETVPSPPAYIGGAILNGTHIPEAPIYFTGTANDGLGFRKAALWQRDGVGNWTVSVLPDFGVPKREAEASGIATCPDNAPASLCDAGALLIAGWAQDGPGVRRPVIWRETSESSGMFEMILIPMVQKVRDAISPWRCAFSPGQGGPLFLSDMGTVALIDGTTRGIVWRTSDFTTWDWVWLPELPWGPLPEEPDSSKVIGGVFPKSDDAFVVFGTSYPSGGDPSADGVATQYWMDMGVPVLVSGPRNMNFLISGLPPGHQATALELGGQELGDAYIAYELERAYITTYQFVGGAAAGGTPMPHAAIGLSGAPAGIPAVTTWGLVILSLTLMASATLAIRRRCLSSVITETRF